MSHRWTLLLVVASCGGSPVMSGASSGGTVTVSFVGQPLKSGLLTLQTVSMVLKDVSLFGDVQSAPSFQLPDVSVDLAGATTPVRVDGLPPGLYSRLRFAVEALSVAGTWKDYSLALTLEDNDGDDDDLGVDLRALPGAELLPGQTVGFDIGIDVSSWFAGVDLDAAAVGADRRIRLDDDDNGVLMSAIVAAVSPSFALTAAGP